MRHSKINLELYLSPEDVEILRDKKNRNVKGKSRIVERSLQLVLEAKTGNIKSRNELFLLHTPLMRSVLNKTFDIKPDEFDDYLSWCFESFCDSVMSFNPEKSNNFIPLLRLNIKNFFINKYKSKEMRQISRTTSLDKICETDELNSEKLLYSEDKSFDEINEL